VKDEGPLQKKKAGRLVESFSGGKAPDSEGGRYKGKRGCGLGHLKVAATRPVSRVLSSSRKFRAIIPSPQLD
jgi:hypothetical protein